jgi:tRNA G18 (ribose-2'-O)-methylase SpoU
MRKLTHEEIGRNRLSPEQLAREERFPVTILLDNIRSLYNVGSIFRSADGARVSRLILSGYTPHPPRKEIEKTALGATATVPWTYVRDPLEAIAGLKSGGVRICVLEQTGSSTPYYSISKESFPLCLVVGNEITGVSGEILREADFAVDIPMYGMKQSLNAAVALGITVFELVRIWKSE